MKYILRTAYTIVLIIFLSIILTTLYYFNLIGPITNKFLKIFIPIISIFINSFILGRKTLNKGYLEGFKLSLIFISIFLVSSLITKSFSFKLILYYLIIIITSILGSMIGINTKKES